VGNAQVVPVITYHFGARNTPVRLTPTHSLQQTAMTAGTYSTKVSNLSTPSKQITSVPHLVLHSAGDVGRERAWVGQGGVAAVNGHVG